MSDDLPADLRRVSGVILNRLDDATNVLARQMILKNAKAVQMAADRIEQLEAEAVLDAKLLADTQALLDTALEAVIDAKLVAEAKVQSLEAERDAAIAALEESGRKRGETLALLDKAVVALRKAADGLDGYVGHGYGDYLRDVLAEIEGGKKDG